jgi:pyruvate formate lyase activating enzyme
MQNLEQTARFVSELPGEKKQVNLLPYHAIAQQKYLKLGKPESFEKMAEPDKAVLEKAMDIFAEYGIGATVG